MGDPHNPKRIGETWNQERIDLQLQEIAKIKDLIILSGGWAWHFMSPPHQEYKTQHDHKDIDIFVKPENFEELRQRFINEGYQRVATQYDNPSGQFYRYTKYSETGKIVFDVFLEDIESITANNFQVVEPKKLLSMYGVKHTSEQCTAVIEARKLMAKNISPLGRSELLNRGNHANKSKN